MKNKGLSKNAIILKAVLFESFPEMNSIYNNASKEEKRRMKEQNKEFLKANGIKLEKETNYIK